MSNILTVPVSGAIYFSDGVAGSSTIPNLSAGVALRYDNSAGLNITSFASAASASDRFSIDGASGRLFSVSDSLTGSIFSVNDAAGLPIIEVESNLIDKITMGTYGSNALVVNDTKVGIGTATPAEKLSVVGNTTVTGYVSASQYFGLQSALSGAAALVGGNTLGTNLLIGTNDNFNLNLETGGTTKMTVTSAGLVGIGTSSPNYLFSVKPNSGQVGQIGFRTLAAFASPALYLEDYSATVIYKLGQDTSGALKILSNTDAICFETAGFYSTIAGNGTFIQAGNSTASIQSNQAKILLDTYTTNAIQFFAGTTTTERMRILGSNGNIGIGTTTPVARLDIADTTLAGSGALSGSALNITQTWNTTGNPTAFTLNVTNSASGAASNLLDLQVGGNSKFKIDKDGVTTLYGTFNTCTLKITQTGESNGFGPFGSNATVGFSNGTRSILFGYGGGYTDLRLTAGHRFGWTSDAFSAAAALDTMFTRKSAANIRLGDVDAAAPVAQTLSVQSVAAGTTNLSGTNFTIAGSQGTGTGAGGSIVFQTSPAGSSGTAQNGLSAALTIDSFLNTNSTSNFVVPNVSGKGFWVTGSPTHGGMVNAGGLGGVDFRANAETVLSLVNNAGQKRTAIHINGQFGFHNDITLARDAANTLAQRNDVNPQAFRLYNTFTDSVSAFERLNIKWDANVIKIGTEKGITGGLGRAMEFQTDGTTRMTVTSSGNVGIGTTTPDYKLSVSDNSGGLVFNSLGTFSSRFYHSAYSLTYDAGGLDAGNNARIHLTTTNSNASPSIDFTNSNATSRIYLSANTSSNGNLNFSVQGYTALILRKGDNRQGNAILSSLAGDNTYNNASLLVRNRWDGSPAAVIAKLATSTTADIFQVTNESLSPYFNVNATGSVGISTTTPNERLTVSGNISSSNVVYALGGNSDLWNNTYTTVTTSSANYILDGGNTKGANLLVGTNDNFNLNLETGGTTKMTVTSSGNVGIGTTTPGYKLDVNGTSRLGGNVIVDGDSLTMASSGWVQTWGLSYSGPTTHRLSSNYDLELIGGTSTRGVTIKNSSVETARFTDGRVGIGTMTPVARLDISDTTLAGSSALSGSALNITQTWNTTGNPTAITLNVTNSASGSTSNLLDLQIGGTSRFKVDKNGATTMSSALYVEGGQSALTSSYLQLANSAGRIIFNSNIIHVQTATGLGWFDLPLWRDAANTLAQRNGINPQAFRLYNTYTDSVSAFERLNIKWESDVAKIGTEKGSNSGSARDLVLETNAAERLRVLSTGNIQVKDSLELNTLAPGVGAVKPVLTIYRNGSGGDGSSILCKRDGGQEIGDLRFSGTASAPDFGINLRHNYTAQSNLATFTQTTAGRGSILFGTFNGLNSASLSIYNSNPAQNMTGINLGNLYTSAGSNIDIVFQSYTADPHATIRGVYPGGTKFGSLAFLTANGLAPVEALRITQLGNVGIGTSTPTANLQVNQSTLGTGTISISAAGTTITGVNTQFLNTFKAGDTITSAGQTLTISSITSDTLMTTTSASSTITAAAYTLVGGSRFGVSGNGDISLGAISLIQRTANIDGVNANRLLATGNFGFGGGGYGVRYSTVNNSYRLVVASANSSLATAAYLFGLDGSQQNKGLIYSRDDATISLINGSGGNSDSYTKVLNITESGNVGIGTITPTEKLVVNGSFSVYPNSSNSESRLITRTIHADGRWALDIRANTASGDVQALTVYQSFLGIGSGEFLTGAISSAIGISSNIAHIPKLRIAGSGTGPNNASGLVIGSSSSTEWSSGASYPDGSNYYEIRTNLSSPAQLGAMVAVPTRAPLNIDAKYLSFLTGNTTGVEAMRIASVGNVGIGTSTPVARLDIADTTFAGSSALSGSALNITQTWNTTGNPTAITLNVTNSASGSTSNLLDLKVGGSSMFKVNKNGVAQFGPTSSRAVLFDANGGIGVNRADVSTTQPVVFLGYYTAPRITIVRDGTIGWSSSQTDTSGGNSTPDTVLLRDGAANILGLRNGVNPQSFRVYSTYTDASNYERFFISTNVGATSATQIGLSAAGTGQNRNLEFVTGGSTRWSISSAGNLLAGVDNTYDIGASGATRPRDIFVGRGVLTTGGEMSNFGSSSNFYIQSTGSRALTFISATGLFQFAGSNSSFPAIKRSGAALQVRLADDSGYAALETAGVTCTGTVSAAGDFAVATSLQGVILVSPNSTRWRITVNDNGSLQTTAL